ncbi:TonB-dependent receptor [Rhodohalobacter sp. SW132]|uniref:TonB-dependent receptor n=1 Tax=Rhodohalobacter sp. SW132 TaxID=2293433 RepID=UPI000E26404E|nr:TonB-dependent receptor [Rhodohalobacter sp. SW132]REL33474.1 TonB-dependent receptor [Rhodohalobacter sp. SW132]
MKIFNTTIMAVVLLLLGAGSLEAGTINTNETLKGEVLEAATGEPIPGATIIIQETERGTAADADGRFQFDSLPQGSYTLSIRAVGFTAISLSVDHPEDGFLSIKLQQDIFRADDVIVTSSPIGRSIQYQPAQALNREALQQKAAPSLGEILDGSPGVSTRSFGSAPSRPVIRGLDGDRVLVLQNGERMGDLSGTAVDHAVSLDPLSMDRVEVVRGPASLLYGSSAIGGVVNMFSNDMPRDWDKGPSGSLATHAATVNDMGAGLARFQQGWDSFAVTGRVIYRDGGDIRTPEGRLPDTSVNNVSFGSGLGYRSGNFETGLSVSGMDYTYGLPEAIDDPNENVEIRMNRTNLQSISTLKMDRFFELAELRIQLSDYVHDEIESEINPDGSVDEDLEISFNQQTVSSSLLLRHRPIGRFEGALGLSMNYSQLTVGGDEALTPDADSYFLAGYLYEEIRLNSRFNVKTGARLEFKETFVKTNELFTDPGEFEDRSDLIFAGAIGLNYTPNRNWEAGFQVARAFRTPGIEELYSNAPHLAAGSFDIGDPTLDNETSIGTDLFLKYRSNRIYSELSLYVNRINNFINFSPTGEIHGPSGLPVFEYGSTDALLYGFEFQTDIAFTDQLRAGVGFDYVRGRERTGDQNDLPFIPPFRTHLSMMYDTGDWWAGPRLRIANSQDRVAPNEDPTDGYLLVGMDAGYRLGHGVSFSVRVDNLLNESYRDHLSRVEDRNNPMPARNINAMLRWEF